MKFFKSETEYNQEKINSSFLELIKEINIKKDEYTNKYGEAPKIIAMSQAEFKIISDYCNSYQVCFSKWNDQPKILGIKIIVE